MLHYVSFDKFEALLVSPTPCDLATVQGPSHQHVLYNFYAACLRMHDSFERLQHKKVRNLRAHLLVSIFFFNILLFDTVDITLGIKTRTDIDGHFTQL